MICIRLIPVLLLFLLENQLTAAGSEDKNRKKDSGKFEAFACEGSALNLTCDDDNVIKVKRANFGRFSIEVCNDEARVDWSVNCFAPKAREVLSRECDGRTGCRLSAGDFDFGPDPCPGTERYLEAHFECVRLNNSVNSGGSTEQNGAGFKLNSRRKPMRRVPITAPPPITRFPTTTTTTSASSTAAITTTLRPSPTRPVISSTKRTQEKFVSAAPVYYENNNEDEDEEEEEVEETAIRRRRRDFCPSRRARSIIWPETKAGSTAVQPCPQEGRVSARWKCDESGKWSKNGRTANPDLSQCRSIWITPLIAKISLAPPSGSFSAAIVELDQHLAVYPIYGGDVTAVLDVARTALGRLQGGGMIEADTEAEYNTKTMKTLGRLLRCLSALLEDKGRMAWADLPQKTRTQSRRELISLAVDLAESLPELISSLPNGATVISPNIYVTVTMISSSAVNTDDLVLHFPGVISPSEFRVDLAEGSPPRLAGEMLVTRRSLVNVVDKLPHLVFVSLSNLDPFPVLSCSSSGEDSLDLSDPVLVSLKTGDRRKMRGPDSALRCLAWNEKNAFWDHDICSTVEANATHITCNCTRLTRYTIGQESHLPGHETAPDQVDLRRENRSITFTAAFCVALTSSLLVLTILGFVFIIIYCRRVKIRDSKRDEDDDDDDGGGGESQFRRRRTASASHQNLIGSNSIMTPSNSASLDWFNDAGTTERRRSTLRQSQTLNLDALHDGFPGQYSNLTLASFGGGGGLKKKGRRNSSRKAPSSILTGSLGHFLRWRKSSADGDGNGRRRRRKRLGEEASGVVATGAATTWLYDEDPRSETLRRFAQRQQAQHQLNSSLWRHRPYPPYYVNDEHFNPAVSAIYEFPLQNPPRAASVSSGSHIYMEVPDRRSSGMNPAQLARYFDDSGYNEESSDVTSGSNNNTGRVRAGAPQPHMIPSSSSSSFGTHRQKRHNYVNDAVQSPLNEWSANNRVDGSPPGERRGRKPGSGSPEPPQNPFEEDSLMRRNRRMRRN